MNRQVAKIATAAQRTKLGRLATDVARQISSALKHGLAGKKIGEAIALAKWREHKEPAGGDALHGIDPVAAEASPNLISLRPRTQLSEPEKSEGVLIRIAWAVMGSPAEA